MIHILEKCIYEMKNKCRRLLAIYNKIKNETYKQQTVCK